jgi:hypothetical protein
MVPFGECLDSPRLFTVLEGVAMGRRPLVMLCCGVFVGILVGCALWGPLPASSPRYVPGDCLLELSHDITRQVKELGRESYVLGSPTYYRGSGHRENFGVVDN